MNACPICRDADCGTLLPPCDSHDLAGIPSLRSALEMCDKGNWRSVSDYEPDATCPHEWARSFELEPGMPTVAVYRMCATCDGIEWQDVEMSQ